MPKNQIICILEEDVNGENHNIHVQASWTDSHHFLDMVSAIINKWKFQEHENMERVKNDTTTV